MNTPFIFGKTVSGEAFTDRENETAKLVSNFRYGVNTFIVSPRRWGKTSLVKKVKGLVENEKLKIVYVDVQKCRCKEDFCERFASAVLSQTATKMDEWLENAKTFLGRFSFGVNASPDPTNEMSLKINLSPKERSMEDLLQLPERIANRKGFRVIVCIDEFQQIGNYPDTVQFQTELRSVWQHHELTSYCLFGSRKHMMEALFDDETKPFYKFGDIIYLQKKRKCASREFRKYPIHIVEVNQSLFDISQLYGIRLESLCELNGWDEPHAVQVGEILRIR